VRVDGSKARNYDAEEAAAGNRSVRILERQIHIRDAGLLSAAMARREVLNCRPAPKSESTHREDANP
jgi:hypothetical protein